MLKKIYILSALCLLTIDSVLAMQPEAFPYDYEHINAQDTDGNTLLHRTTTFFPEPSLNFDNPQNDPWYRDLAQNHFFVFQFLLTAKEINLNIKNNNGDTALIGLFDHIFVYGDLMFESVKLFLGHSDIDMGAQQPTINKSFMTGVNAVLKQGCSVLDNQQALEYILSHVNDKEMLEELLSELEVNGYWSDFNKKIKQRIQELP